MAGPRFVDRVSGNRVTGPPWSPIQDMIADSGGRSARYEPGPWCPQRLKRRDTIPPPMDLKDRRALEGILGYRFRNPRVLEAAVTHGSRREQHPEVEIEDYERLEFLGDAVLELVVSAELFREHPSWRPGDLTKARSKIVSQRPLAAVARRLGIDRFVELGASVRERAGRERILSDVVEALLAAVYVDSGGIDAAAEVIRRCILAREPVAPAPEARPARPRKEPARPPVPPKPRAVSPRRTPSRLPQARTSVAVKGDFKTQLQNLLQTRHEPLPEYRVLHEVGPEHQKIWIVEAAVGNRFRFTGKGPSKKEAEQRAARAALAQLGSIGRSRVERSPL